MSSEAKWIVGLLIGCLLIVCFLGVACLMAGGLTWWGIRQTTENPAGRPGVLEPFEAPTPSISTRIPTLPPQSGQPTAGGAAQDTLAILENELVPINDPVDLAFRLEGKLNVPETLPADNLDLAVGAQKEFWVSNVDRNEYFRITATLRYETDHLYFWIENGVDFDQGDLRELSETFENQIYPVNRAFFGSEWTPGVDNDPHLYVLYAGGLGNSLAGYFSSGDAIHPLASEYSNAHEMFLINADNVSLDGKYIYATMAHEFQHMIHWYRDRNEETWMNEGFSVLAELLNDFSVGVFDRLYVMDPDLQLTTWSGSGENSAHYGASFLFLAYFLDRFGEQATQALVAHPDNGMDSIDAVLRELKISHPTSGSQLGANDVFADWVVTNYINDPKVEDGQYAYQRYKSAPATSNTEEFYRCPLDWQTRTVKQYGVDYIKIDCNGTYTVQFEGTSLVNLLPVDPASGDYAYWSNYGDGSDMTLTRAFDFTAASGPLTLTYNTWYDLETDYDYVYVLASEDGQTWKILRAPSSTDDDPSGNSYGWAYNGQTGGWIQEAVDLSQFAGKQVQLRFEYITDAAVNGEGLLLDDIRVPEIGYQTDFEYDDGGWVGEGFVRIQNWLPQTFVVSLIRDGRTISVERLVLNEQQQTSLSLDLSEGVVLVVSGTTRFTLSPSTYRFQIVP
jgi:immune inhibitor A